jgi:hypothetical protein
MTGDARAGAIRVVVEEARAMHEMQEARPGGIVWVSPFARDGAGGYQHGGTYLHERLDTPR